MVPRAPHRGADPLGHGQSERAWSGEGSSIVDIVVADSTTRPSVVRVAGAGPAPRLHRTHPP